MVYHHYVEDGVRKIEKIRFKPSLGVTAGKDTGWKDIYGNDIGIVQFDNIFEMYGWRKENADYIAIYGDVPPIYQFLSQTYTKTVEFKPSEVRVAIIDIEVKSDQGFPYPANPIYPITAITVQDLYKDKFYTFGCQPYTPKDDRVTYILCKNEVEMLEKFVKFWRKMRPDVITGWNSEAFDIPYIAGRIKIVLGEEERLKLSPVNEIRNSHTQDGQECLVLTGIQHIDYMQLYKMRKFSVNPMESYSLKFVSTKELGVTKVDYQGEYGTLHELYEKNFTKFMDYNIRDTELIALLNEKKRYLELVMTMAYMAKVNYEDAIGSVKLWDIFVYNELKKAKMVVSPKPKHVSRSDFPGGYVMEPTHGMKEWLVVADITSSYPNQIISFNLSPETVIDDKDLPEELYELKYKMKAIDGFIDLEKIEEIAPLLKKHNVTFSANCEFFTKKRYGIFPQIVQRVFDQRKIAKEKAKVMKNELDQLKQELKELQA